MFGGERNGFAIGGDRFRALVPGFEDQAIGNVRLGALRPRLHGLIDAGSGFVEPFLAKVDEREIVVSVRKIQLGEGLFWEKFDGLLGGGSCFRQLALISEDETEIEPSQAVVGSERGGLADGSGSSFQVTAAIGVETLLC